MIFTICCHTPGGDAAAAVAGTTFYTIYIQSPQSNSIIVLLTYILSVCVVQVKASDPSVISGYLSMSSNARSWQRRWFAVHKDFVLYSFKAHQV